MLVAHGRARGGVAKAAHEFGQGRAGLRTGNQQCSDSVE
jgi:hypothetical protein